jgi:hypothetical protein
VWVWGDPIGKGHVVTRSGEVTLNLYLVFTVRVGVFGYFHDSSTHTGMLSVDIPHAFSFIHVDGVFCLNFFFPSTFKQ